MLTSNMANHPQNYFSADGLNPMHIPDNITDLDHQNRIVDSIQDEFEYSFHSHYEDTELFMS
jgi:hypothetical protein